MDLDVVVTGVFTLLAALGGVWLTQRHAGRQAYEMRAEARRDSQRRVISDLLIAGRAKVGFYELLLPVFGRMCDKDRLEFVDTDTGRDLRRANDEMSRALVQASLLIGDEAILREILHVRTLDLQFSEKALEPAVSKNSGFDGVLQGLSHNYDLAGALQKLEITAGSWLRAPIALPERMGRRIKVWLVANLNRTRKK